MKKIFLILLFSVSLFAKIEFVKVKTVGYGSTKEEALQNALIRALERVNGVGIGSSKAMVKGYMKSDIYVNGYKSATVESFSKGDIQSVYSKRNGGIKSYKILSLKKSKEGFKAKILATVAKYSTGYKDKKSLAVFPFAYKVSYEVYGIEIDGKALSQRVADSLTDLLVQKGLFKVLDRKNINYMKFEKAFLLDMDANPVELSRIGKRLGADYFVIGKILDFGIDVKDETNYYTGVGKYKNQAYITISYRVLNIPTGSVEWADTIDTEFDFPPAKRAESLILKASKKIAKIVADKIVARFGDYKIKEIRADKVLDNKEEFEEGKDSMFDEMFSK